MYIFPAVSSATSVGPQKPAEVAGPPSPRCSPPPATVVSSGFGFEAASGLSLPPPPQPASATPQITSTAIDMVTSTSGRLIGRPPSLKVGRGEECKAALTASLCQVTTAAYSPKGV